MRKKLIVALALLIILCLLSGVNADDKFKTGSWRIDTDSVLIPSTSESVGMRAIFERVSTSDTVTATESGKTFVLTASKTASNDYHFTLPTAVRGLTYTFVSGVGGCDTGGVSNTCSIVLHPASTDRFRGLTADGESFAAGDRLRSPGTTGDSVTIMCVQTLYWDIVDMRNTWVDAN